MLTFPLNGLLCGSAVPRSSCCIGSTSVPSCRNIAWPQPKRYKSTLSWHGFPERQNSISCLCPKMMAGKLPLGSSKPKLAAAIFKVRFRSFASSSAIRASISSLILCSNDVSRSRRAFSFNFRRVSSSFIAASCPSMFFCNSLTDASLICNSFCHWFKEALCTFRSPLVFIKAGSCLASRSSWQPSFSRTSSAAAMACRDATVCDKQCWSICAVMLPAFTMAATHCLRTLLHRPLATFRCRMVPKSNSLPCILSNADCGAAW